MAAYCVRNCFNTSGPKLMPAPRELRDHLGAQTQWRVGVPRRRPPLGPSSACLTLAPHTLDGPFSAVSNPILATKSSFYKAVRDLLDLHNFCTFRIQAGNHEKRDNFDAAKNSFWGEDIL